MKKYNLYLDYMKYKRFNSKKMKFKFNNKNNNIIRYYE